MVHELQHIGLIVIFGVVMIPVYAMVLGWIAGKPRDGRSTVLGLGYLVGFLAFLIAGTWIAGRVIGLVMGV